MGNGQEITIKGGSLTIETDEELEHSPGSRPYAHPKKAKKIRRVVISGDKNFDEQFNGNCTIHIYYKDR